MQSGIDGTSHTFGSINFLQTTNQLIIQRQNIHFRYASKFCLNRHNKLVGNKIEKFGMQKICKLGR